MMDRDRLIELLRQGQKEYSKRCFEETKKILYEKHTYNSETDKVYSLWEELADYLLANGVIVPPCKVGDTVYFLNNLWHIVLPRYTIYPAKIIGIKTTKLETSFEIQIQNETGCWDIPNCKLGKNLFLTKEEAEEKLKELG